MMKKNKTLFCVDGFSMSVQADQGAYCTPRNDIGPYTSVEIGYPSQREPALLDFAENPDDPTETVYGWVPSETVWEVILKHGGVDSGELPVLVLGPQGKDSLT